MSTQEMWNNYYRAVDLYFEQKKFNDTINSRISCLNESSATLMSDKKKLESCKSTIESLLDNGHFRDANEFRINNLTSEYFYGSQEIYFKDEFLSKLKKEHNKYFDEGIGGVVATLNEAIASIQKKINDNNNIIGNLNNQLLTVVYPIEPPEIKE